MSWRVKRAIRGGGADEKVILKKTKGKILVRRTLLTKKGIKKPRKVSLRSV